MKHWPISTIFGVRH